jgi:hypothetical protein
MKNHKIEVYNYLDMHAVINNRIIEVFSITKNYKKRFQKWMNSH